MPYLLLVTIAASITAQNALKKQYNLHSKKPAPFFFSLMLSAVAMLFFILTSGFRLEFNSGIIVYSVGFALSYGAALIGTMQAIASGPLALTLLFSSYSLLIPTVHGLIALDEKLGTVGIIGLALLILSILLLNLKKDSEKINLKWFVYMLLSFFGNGFCSLQWTGMQQGGITQTCCSPNCRQSISTFPRPPWPNRKLKPQTT